MAEEGKDFCFVISPIGEPTSRTRRIANGVLEEIIEPALEDEFHVERADHDPAPGIVTHQIIENLIEADLVVADLSSHNPNVMYELAIRHAQEKPFVHIAQNGTELPFDIAPVHVVFYNPGLAGRSDTVRELRQAAQEAISQERVGNPIGSAVQFMELSRTGSASDRALADAVQELGSQFSALRNELTHRQLHGPPHSQDPTPQARQGSRLRLQLGTASVSFPGSDRMHRCEGCGDEKEENELQALYIEWPEEIEADAILCSECLLAAEDNPEFAASVLDWDATEL